MVIRCLCCIQPNEKIGLQISIKRDLKALAKEIKTLAIKVGKIAQEVDISEDPKR